MHRFILSFVLILYGTSLSVEWHSTDYGRWTVSGFVNTPFPDSGITEAGFSDKSVFIFVPAGYQPGREIHLIVDHHGHGAIIDPENQEKPSYPELHRQAYQLYESRKNAILVMPQAARNKASSSAGRFTRFGKFASFIDEVCTFLKNESVIPDTAVLGQIHLNSFSGGYLITSMDISANPPDFIAHIRSVHLWDSFYGQQDVYYDWVFRQKGYFFDTHTPNGGTRELSLQLSDSLSRAGIEHSNILPVSGELPQIIIEPTDKFHGDVSCGEFAYGRYLKRLPLPDSDITATDLLSCMAVRDGTEIRWEKLHNDHLKGYRLWYAPDRGTWILLADEKLLSETTGTFFHKTTLRCRYKLQVVSRSGKIITAPFILAADPGDSVDRILIVHAENRRLARQVRGFDPASFLFRRDSDLVLSAANHLNQPFSSCSNLAIQSGLVKPGDFSTVIWLAGKENTRSKLLDATEKNWFREFRENGSDFLLSGYNVAQEFGSPFSSPNDTDFGERMLGIAGSDTLISDRFVIDDSLTAGFEPDTAGHYAFSKVIRPVFMTGTGQVVGACVKRQQQSGNTTMLALSFSLSDITPAPAINGILQALTRISHDAPVTPDPPATISSIAFTLGEVHLLQNEISNQIILTTYDSNRVSIRSDTIQTEIPVLSPEHHPEYLRLRGMSGDLCGKSSPIVATFTDPANRKRVLIVDGFERKTPANSRDFIIEHAVIFKSLGYNFDSATNHAVTDLLVDPGTYDIVDWILGEESSGDDTFTPREQELLAGYVKKGGLVIVSGSEIGWDLQARAQSATDSLFLHEILGVRYIDDNAETDSCFYFTPAGDKIMIQFGRTYPVDYPDVFGVVGSGIELLQYTGGRTAAAGKRHRGGGKTVIAGFPLETVQPESSRKALFRFLLDFLELSD
jgi:hypothetical protein